MVVSKLPEEITVKYIEDNLATFVSKQNANAIKIQKYQLSPEIKAKPGRK